MNRSIIIGAASLVNVSLGIIFQIALLVILGPGRHSDALFAALTIPQLFATVIATALVQVLVPILAGESKQAAQKSIWSFLVLLLPIFAVLSIILALSVNWWVPQLVPGFDAAGKAEAIALTRISVAGILFTGVIAVQQAAAFARGHYVWPDIAMAIANAIGLALLILFMPQYGVFSAAWIILGRLALQFLLMLNCLGVVTRPSLSDPVIIDGWRRIKPLVLGTSYYKLDPLIDRFLLSSLAPGNLSLFTLAQQLYAAGSQVVTKALAVPAQTRMAALAKRGELAEFERVLKRGLFTTTLFCLSCIVGLALIGLPVLTELLAFGQFDAALADQFWLVLLAACGLFILGPSSSLLAGAFYARGDTRTPTLIGSASFTASVAVKLLLFWAMGIIGLALAVSIQYTLSALLMGIWLQRHAVVDWKSGEIRA